MKAYLPSIIDNLSKTSPQLTTKLTGYTVAYPNQSEFLSLKHEIFVRHDYYLDFADDKPITQIVDLGAHIGLSSLYFAKQYPIAQITAVEPHPDAVDYLRHNIWENRLDERVTVIEAAVVPNHPNSLPSHTTLYTDPTDGWWSTTSAHTGAWTGDQTTQPLSVPTVSLEELINQPTDIVKIDIEGAEQALLQSQNPQTLQLIHNLLVEFHPHPTQSLTTFLEFLERVGFTKITLWQDGKSVEARYTHNRLALIIAQR